MVASGRRSRSLRVQPCQQHGRLCLPITLAQTWSEDFYCLLKLIRRNGRPGQEKHPQARIVELPDIGMSEQLVESCRRQEQVRHSVLLDTAQDFTRIESWEYDIGRSDGTHRECNDAGGVRERGYVQANRLHAATAPVVRCHLRHGSPG